MHVFLYCSIKTQRRFPASERLRGLDYITGGLTLANSECGKALGLGLGYGYGLGSTFSYSFLRMKLSGLRLHQSSAIESVRISHADVPF